QSQNRRLGIAIEREAKSQTHLLHAGRAVPQLFRGGGTHQRRDRGYAVTAARAAFGQCGVSPWFRDFPPPGAAISTPWPRCGERPESEYPVLRGERGRGDRDSRKQPQAANPGDCEGVRQPPKRAHVAGQRSRQLQGPRAGAAKTRRYSVAGQRTVDRGTVQQIKVRECRDSRPRLTEQNSARSDK